ncbi:MAG: hypothetical protein K2X99_07045 [Gemmatimonadaceae bacterium]|nr:hypothetical protein [Gemmatimonadaceae bacterium]
MDFRAAQRIREPDVHGTILLDPVTFQIRRATFELSKVPKEIPDLRAAIFEADFAEVVPSIVIFERVTGRSVLTPMRVRNPVTEIVERQKLIAFRFLHRDPRVAPPSP